MGHNRRRQHLIFANGTQYVSEKAANEYSPRDSSFRNMIMASNSTGFVNEHATPGAETRILALQRNQTMSAVGSMPNTKLRGEPTESTPLIKNASPSDVAKAIQVVEDAMAESIRLNAKRLANPKRNNYGQKYRIRSRLSSRETRLEEGHVPSLLRIIDEIAAAAALVSELEARNDTAHVAARGTTATARSGTFWMEHLPRKGTVPWGDDGAYKVFRNVVDYGAVGDGVTGGQEYLSCAKDDTKAINAAMRDGNRCANKCNGSTTKNAIIYFPPGRYRVSTTIEMPFGTQAIRGW